jgi:ribosomal protein L14E/L6E/L27E
LEPACGDTDEAAVAVVAAGRAAGEEVVVVRDAIG